MSKDEGLIFSMDSIGIQQKISQYLQVRTEEKDKFGEVFTPGELIDDMLDKIPPTVWKDPALKWLDPANGTGNFPMKVYERLLKDLPNSYDGPVGKYSDEKGKKRHILKNMLYMVELNPRNVKIARKIFGSKANICCANFLEEESKWKNAFGVETFDVIVGNPPYNDNGVGKGGGVLWKEFVFKSFT
jgi:type I restriction-modification system DNA methylase subunit